MGISGLLLIHCPVARELQATVVVLQGSYSLQVLYGGTCGFLVVE